RVSSIIDNSSASLISTRLQRQVSLHRALPPGASLCSGQLIRSLTSLVTFSIAQPMRTVRSRGRCSPLRSTQRQLSPTKTSRPERLTTTTSWPSITPATGANHQKLSLRKFPRIEFLFRDEKQEPGLQCRTGLVWYLVRRL